MKRNKVFKDYFGREIDVFVLDSFVEIEMDDKRIVLSRSEFLKINNMIMKIWLLDNE